jgi:catechol 2,3-dioxygenase-like lactoylglutathione lyase family enzyme
VRVLRLAWLGVATSEHDAMLRLLRDVMGLKVEFEEPDTTELSTESDDRVQLFSPGSRYYDFFHTNAAGPVALFEVDDVHAARAELEVAGIEVIGEPESDSTWTWVNFRAPDGNLYELASRR